MLYRVSMSSEPLQNRYGRNRAFVAIETVGAGEGGIGTPPSQPSLRKTDF